MPAAGRLAIACLLGAAGCGYVEIRKVNSAETAAARLREAREHLGGGDLGGAERALEEALAQDPRLVEAHELYQDIFRSTGREGWLADRYARLRESFPDDPSFLYLEARALARGRDRQVLLDRVLRDRPGFAPARRLACEDLRREGAFAKALELADRDGGQDASLLRLAADLCLDLRRTDAAWQRALRAIDRDPRDPAGYDLAAEIAVASGDGEAIEALADRAAGALPACRVRSLLEILRGFPPEDLAGMRRMDDALLDLCEGGGAWALPRLILARIRRPVAPAAAAEAIRSGALEDPSPRRTALLHTRLIEALEEAGLSREIPPVLMSGERRIPERWELALARAEHAWLAGNGAESASAIARHAATYGFPSAENEIEALRVPPPDTQARGAYLALRGLLSGPSSGAKVRGLQALPAAIAPCMAPLLVRAIGDPSDSVRTVAVRAFARAAPHLAEEACRNLLADPSPRVRAAALGTLGRNPDRSDLEFLLGGLEDPDPYVREVAIIGLERRRGDRLGFDPAGDPAERAAAVGRWRSWLAELPGS
ncbi:MAG: HEAT repeat domain-containing protein [Planctomycetes bacterium]|nr:HEAT repeat domain-containing protein [Planctomycetota bacterium]